MWSVTEEAEHLRAMKLRRAELDLVPGKTKKIHYCTGLHGGSCAESLFFVRKSLHAVSSIWSTASDVETSESSIGLDLGSKLLFGTLRRLALLLPKLISEFGARARARLLKRRRTLATLPRSRVSSKARLLSLTWSHWPKDRRIQRRDVSSRCTFVNHHQAFLRLVYIKSAMLLLLLLLMVRVCFAKLGCS